MKKLLFAAMFIVLGAMLYASPIAFGLDSSFDIPYLMANNYNLKIEDETIYITPPKAKLIGDDKNIEEFAITCAEGSDDWIMAYILFRDGFSYDDAYRYVKKSYGEGMSKENTEFFIDRYSQEPSEEVIMSKLFSGELGSYLSNFMVSMLFYEFVGSDDVNVMNMWQKEDLSIISISAVDSGKTGVIFFNKNAVDEMISTIFKYSMFGSM